MKIFTGLNPSPFATSPTAVRPSFSLNVNGIITFTTHPDHAAAPAARVSCRCQRGVHREEPGQIIVVEVNGAQPARRLPVFTSAGLKGGVTAASSGSGKGPVSMSKIMVFIRSRKCVGMCLVRLPNWPALAPSSMGCPPSAPDSANCPILTATPNSILDRLHKSGIGATMLGRPFLSQRLPEDAQDGATDRECGAQSGAV